MNIFNGLLDQPCLQEYLSLIKTTAILQVEKVPPSETNETWDEGWASKSYAKPTGAAFLLCRSAAMPHCGIGTQRTAA